METGFGNGLASPIYSDGFGLGLRQTTLVWHMRTKGQPHRIAYAHHWSEIEGGAGHQCDPRRLIPPRLDPPRLDPTRLDPTRLPSTKPGPSTSWVRCGRASERASTISCSGARWLQGLTQCPVSLWHYLLCALHELNATERHALCGAGWLRCTTARASYAASNCTTTLFDLKRAAHA